MFEKSLYLRPFVLTIIILTGSACAQTASSELGSHYGQTNPVFADQIERLAENLTIDGVAYAVVQSGEVIASGEVATVPDNRVTLQTPLRFASITKAFTATALMKEAEQGRLDLDATAISIVPDLDLPPDVSVRHLAGHISEGEIGREYVYGTNRYAKLERILSTVAAAPLEAIFKSHIIEPSGMRWHDSPSLGAHAGMVSTVNDMAKFIGALQANILISANSFKVMTTPTVLGNGEDGPVGIGWFSQVIGGQQVIWSFGQDDPDHSSALVLMLPEQDFALVMLANTDELSNPFRLLMGDVRYSPFAVAFLEAYAPESVKNLPSHIITTTNLLTLIWNNEIGAAQGELSKLKSEHPDAFSNGGNLVLHFAAARLTQMQDDLMNMLDSAVTTEHPSNRWALLISANYNMVASRSNIAKSRFESIIALPNQEDDFLRQLFLAWSFTGLARLTMESDPDVALGYIQQGLKTGVPGPTRQDLLDLEELISMP